MAAVRWAGSSGAESINTRRGVHFVRGSTLELGPPAQDAPGVATCLEEVKLPSERSRQSMARFPAASVCLARWEVWTYEGCSPRGGAGGVNGRRAG
jgi:hypothetical protein